MRRRLAAVLALDTVGYSRLVGLDAAAAIRAVRSAYREMVRPAIDAHGGRVAKLAGDGALVEFASAFDAVHCAVRIQRGLELANTRGPDGRPLLVRAGLHVGDVVDQDGDLFGNAVNIAARLEAMAEPGGIYLSREVRDSGGLDRTLGFRDLGPHALKNIDRPVHVFAVDLAARDLSEGYRDLAARQVVRFCRARDGTRLAYASAGEGPAVVKAANWLNHLELDWLNPLYRHLFGFLASRHTLWRHDARGNGLSDWAAESISFDDFVDDLASVVEAAGVTRAPFVGLSQGCAVSIAYAARHPERVSSLVLIGGFAQGRERRASQHAQEGARALQQLMRTSWEDEYPSLRALLAEQLAPSAPLEEKQVFADQMRQATNAATMARIRAAIDQLDVTGLLPQVQVPTLVLHGRNDRMQPLEQGCTLAAGIPGAQLVVLDTDNHLMTAHESAWAHAREEIDRFLRAVGS